MNTQPTTQLPASAPLSSSDLLADLKSRAGAAWSAYETALQKAAQDRKDINATLYAVYHTWSELNFQLQRAKLANK